LASSTIFAHLFRGFREQHEQRQLQAQVGGVGGAFDARVRRVAYALGGHEVHEPPLELAGEGLVLLVALPKPGHRAGQQAWKLAGKAGPGDGELPVHAFAHQFRVHKGVVAHKKKLRGQAHGELAYAVGPLGEAALLRAGGKAQHAGQDAFIGNGNMRADQGHVASVSRLGDVVQVGVSRAVKGGI